MRRTIMTVTTRTTTTMKATLTTTTTTIKQQRKGDTSLFAIICWEWCRCIRRDVHRMARRLRKMVMFLRYFGWLLGSSGDPPTNQCVNHPHGLGTGWSDAEKGVWVHSLGFIQRDFKHVAKRHRKIVIFLRYFWWFLVLVGTSGVTSVRFIPGGLGWGALMWEKWCKCPFWGHKMGY